MPKRVVLLVLVFSLARSGKAQSSAPYLYQVVPYATVQQTGTFAGTVANKSGCTASGCTGTNGFVPANFTPQNTLNSTLGLAGSLDGGIATALSVLPLASPASGVITKTDPTTGAELPASSTLGPIFTERAETIGRHKFYIGFSNQTFHFTSFNGNSLRSLQLLDPGGETTAIAPSSAESYTLGADVRISQNVAFLTYGVTSRVDVSVGLPVVHAAVSANGTNLEIYAGNGFGQNGSLCWCVGTLTPGSAPGTPAHPRGAGLSQQQLTFDQLGKTGFGDLLLRAKGTVLERQNVAFALGADVRLPTGDERNFLGTGAVAVKPFAALSLYTKPWSNGIVFSPHLNVGWQIAGQSILGGQINATVTPVTVNSSLGAAGITTEYAPPFTATKDYLPDVFSWAVGSEVAFGKHNTVVIDFLGNEIGWIHGIPQLTTKTMTGPQPESGTAKATSVTLSGLTSAGRQSFGQYSGAFGYKARVVASLVATVNVLVRFDSNGLTARYAPLFGLSYTF